jgi:hypothetical protein
MPIGKHVGCVSLAGRLVGCFRKGMVAYAALPGSAPPAVTNSWRP